MRVKKGETVSVGVRFRRGKTLAVFTNPPRWTLYNSDDQELLSGAATPENSEWKANFTVPTTYIVPGGAETLTVQFVGFDRENAEFISNREITVEDSQEEFVPTALLYNTLTREPVVDTLVLPFDRATVSAQVFLPDETLLYEVPAQAKTAANSITAGYVYEFMLPLAEVLPPKYVWLDPLQVVYTVDGVTSEIHQVYVANAKVFSVISSLTTFLDKARLQEIDPSFQWQLVELVQSVYEGIKYVNGSEPEGTYWNITNFPLMLDTYLFSAAAHYAISARSMAEGLNSFEFSGLNTNLIYDRKEVLDAKLSDLVARLDRLPQAKRSAIMSSGKGTPPPGVTDARRRNLGVLRVTANPLNNRFGHRGRSRFLLY